jgi:hypothetical protein
MFDFTCCLQLVSSICVLFHLALVCNHWLTSSLLTSPLDIIISFLFFKCFFSVILSFPYSYYFTKISLLFLSFLFLLLRLLLFHTLSVFSFTLFSSFFMITVFSNYLLGAPLFQTSTSSPAPPGVFIMGFPPLFLYFTCTFSAMRFSTSFGFIISHSFLISP